MGSEMCIRDRAYMAGSDRSSVFGSADEEVLVEVDNAKLSALDSPFKK